MRAFERIRRLTVAAPAPPAPPAGAEARFTGPLTLRPWRDDVRLGDEDLTGWLLRELGGDPGTTGVPVEVVVRVLDDDDDDDRRTGASG
jgi:hypothetical protein